MENKGKTNYNSDGVQIHHSLPLRVSMERVDIYKWKERSTLMSNLKFTDTDFPDGVYVYL